jgi:hypothetical protein
MVEYCVIVGVSIGYFMGFSTTKLVFVSTAFGVDAPHDDQ